MYRIFYYQHLIAEVIRYKINTTLNKEKRHHFTQAMSDDQDDEVDEFDSEIFFDRNTQDLRRLKQKKHSSFRQ